MSRRVMLLLAGVVLVGCRSVQNVQSTNPAITWEQPNTSPDLANKYQYTLFLLTEGVTTETAIPITGHICADTGCSALLPVAGAKALLTGSQSRIQAHDSSTGLNSERSDPFYGSSECVWQEVYYSTGDLVVESTQKSNLNSLLENMRLAKFRFLSMHRIKGQVYQVTEECVGFVVESNIQEILRNADSLHDEDTYNSPDPDPLKAPSIRYLDPGSNIPKPNK